MKAVKTTLKTSNLRIGSQAVDGAAAIEISVKIGKMTSVVNPPSTKRIAVERTRDGTRESLDGWGESQIGCNESQRKSQVRESSIPMPYKPGQPALDASEMNGPRPPFNNFSGDPVAVSTSSGVVLGHAGETCVSFTCTDIPRTDTSAGARPSSQAQSQRSYPNSQSQGAPIRPPPPLPLVISNALKPVTQYHVVVDREADGTGGRLKQVEKESLSMALKYANQFLTVEEGDTIDGKFATERGLDVYRFMPLEQVR